MKHNYRYINQLPCLAFILILFFATSGCGSFKEIIDLPKDKHIDTITGNYWQADYSEKSGLNYITTFPKEYSETDKEWPLILFLHSKSERGDSINLLMSNDHGQGDVISKIALKKKQFPFITISPLCPKKSGWPLIDWRLNRLLKEVTHKYKIDRSKIYLTGVSMGGMGTWSLTMDYPDWFAAIAPISGGIYFPITRIKYKSLKNIPVWAFHDKYDLDIPIKNEERKIDKMNKRGINIKYTISETGEHEIWREIYKDSDIYEWFLSNDKE